jgi:hypothetical protein
VLFLFPRSLEVTETRVGRARWYSNLRAYLRLHQPPVSLADLAQAPVFLDPEEAEAAGVVRGRRRSKQLRRLFRLHAQRLRDACRAGFLTLAREIAEHGEASALASVNSFCRDLDAARARLRDAAATVGNEPSGKLPRLIRRCDEWTSLEASDQTLRTMWELQEQKIPVPRACHDLLDAENSWREERGYRSGTMDPKTDGSALLMRLSRLKKMMGSALHLDMITAEPTDRIQQIAFAVAASIAMLWAVGMQLITWWFVGNPVSPDAAPSTILSFTVVAVLAYALKDNIKEGLRGWFRARIPYWLYDRQQVGRDGGEETIASAQESTRFLSVNALDEADLEWYRSVGVLDVPVDVVSYQRNTTLRADLLREGQPEMAGLTEIIRFAVRPWLTHMDNLRQAVWSRAADGTVERNRAIRLYPVVLLIEVNRPNRIERVALRLYVSQRGIERIETSDS